MSAPVITAMTADHIDGVVALQRACFPAPFPEELLWQATHVQKHLELFPEGQFVALVDDFVAASASATLLSEDVWQAHADWDTTVGGPLLSTFDPGGSTLYGLDISVHPSYRGVGLGRELYETRFDLVRSGRAARYGTACRLPGYRDYAINHPGASVEEYADNVVKGLTQDRTLTPLLRYRLTFLTVIREYMEDYESQNAAALLEWRP